MTDIDLDTPLTRTAAAQAVAVTGWGGAAGQARSISKYAPWSSCTIRAEPDQSPKSPAPVFGTMCPNQVLGSDSRPPCWTTIEPSRPSSVRPVICSVATYDRDPSCVPADMNTVV